MNLIVFSNGNPLDARTFSNIPYMFIRTFSRLFPSVRIIPVDINIANRNRVLGWVSKLYNFFTKKFFGELCTFDRTKLFHYCSNKIMRSTIESTAGKGVVLSFDFSNIPKRKAAGYKYSMLCDWTIEYKIEKHLHRKPTLLEKKYIKKQYKTMELADSVVSLFPYAANEINSSCGNVNAQYLGHVINCPVTPTFCCKTRRRNRLLFIGNRLYAQNLQIVISAIEKFNERQIDSGRVFLDVIGINKEMVRLGSSHVIFHGYLDKSKEDECGVFYNLIQSCGALINVSNSWVGASSIIESMAFGTPVIVTPNDELVNMFGEQPAGCIWVECDANSIDKGINKLLDLSAQEYENACRDAFLRVKDFSWESFVAKWSDCVGVY